MGDPKDKDEKPLVHGHFEKGIPLSENDDDDDPVRIENRSRDAEND